MLDETRKLKEWFDESIELLEDSRNLGGQSARYYDGDQLDDNIKLILRHRGQPEHWENNIKKIGSKILGYKKNQQKEIKLFGRQESDRKSAELLQDIIRAINDEVEYEHSIEMLDEDLMIHGLAVSEVSVVQSEDIDSFGRTIKDINISHIPADECFIDPFSKQSDYSDARYFHQAYWIDKEDLYSDFDEEKVDAVFAQNNYLDSQLDEFDDSTTRDRVLLVYSWYREYDKKDKKDKWYYAYWCDDVFLEHEENPYSHIIDTMPIVIEFLKSKNITKQGYSGLFKDILNFQDSINHLKLKIFNMIGGVKLLIQEDSVDDIMIFKDEYSVDNSVTEVQDIGGIKEIKQYQDVQQLLTLVQDTRHQIKETIGVNDEFLASANNRMSGEAIQQRLNIGVLGLYDFISKSANMQKRIIKIMIPMIQEYYDASRVISIVDEDIGRKYFEINKATLDENGFVEYEQDLEGNLGVAQENKISTNKFDIIYKYTDKPLMTSTEKYRQDIELLKLLGSVAPEYVKLLLPEILKDSNTPIADKIKMIIDMQEQAQAQDPMAQQAASMDMLNKQLEIEKQKSEINLNAAKSSHFASKNNIEIEKIQQRKRHDMASNETKQAKTILDAMKGIH